MYASVSTEGGEVFTAKQIKELQKRNALLEEEYLTLKKAIAISLKERLRTVHILIFEDKISTLCSVLKVNRSSYYKHFYSLISNRELENRDIKSKILSLYTSSKKRLGYKKLQVCLELEYGIKISLGRVARLMKQMNLPKMSTSRPFNKNSSDNIYRENIVKQNFSPLKPNCV